MRLSYPISVKIIRVPCTGKVDVLHMMRAFEKGADGAKRRLDARNLIKSRNQHSQMRRRFGHSSPSIQGPYPITGGASAGRCEGVGGLPSHPLEALS